MPAEISPGELWVLVALMLWPLWVVPIAVWILFRLLSGDKERDS